MVSIYYSCSASQGEGSDFNLVSTQKGSTVTVTLQTGASVVLAWMIALVLPPFIFGFSKQITWNCFVQNLISYTSSSLGATTSVF
jgi:hypothetical protein